MILARARGWTRLRGALVATAVVLAPVLSLLGVYGRAPSSVLGVAFARACAAERAATDGAHPRLRVDNEDAHVEDIAGLVPAVAGVKAAAPREGADQPSSIRPSTSALLASNAPDLRPGLDPGMERIPIVAPTRERARLMVFLN